MQLLNHDHVVELLARAQLHGICRECGQRTALDYCCTCDEFYAIHRHGCMMYTDHDGHRLTIVPFVEIQARLS
jgi:hypothetical protein